MTCRWCDLLDDPSRLLHEEEAFVITGEGVGRCPGASIIVVPRQHCRVLGELPPEEMSAILAGLFRVASALRTITGSEPVQLRSHPRPSSVAPGHLHIHVAPKTPGSRAAPGKRRRPGQGEREVQRAVVSLIGERSS